MKIELKKPEVAYRQGLMAIELFFDEKDPVSIHSLAAASYNIFRDLTKVAGTTPMLLKQRSLEFAAPAYHKIWLAHMNKFENFFKHADQDSDAELDFNPDVTEFYLYDVCLKIKETYGNDVPLVNLFLVWFVANRISLFWNDEQKAKNKEFLEAAGHFTKQGKGKFREYFLPLAHSFVN